MTVGLLAGATFAFACGGTQVQHEPTPTPLEPIGAAFSGSHSEASPRIDESGLLPEVWPATSQMGGESDEQTIVDGDAATGFYVDATSWQSLVVLRVMEMPRALDAIAIRLRADALHVPVDVRLTTGDVPFTRASFPELQANATEVGRASVPADGQWVVLPFEDPQIAHYIWIQFLAAESVPVELLDVAVVEAGDVLEGAVMVYYEDPEESDMRDMVRAPEGDVVPSNQGGIQFGGGSDTLEAFEATGGTDAEADGQEAPDGDDDLDNTDSNNTDSAP